MSSDSFYMIKHNQRKKEEILEKTAYDSVVYLTVDTLDHLRKTGRCSESASGVS